MNMFRMQPLLQRPFLGIVNFITLLVMMTINIQEPLAHELTTHLYKTTLDNGLTVVVKETPGTKVATVQIWVKAGSVYEEPHEAGITHLIEHMIFKGTPTRGPGALAEAIEEVGGRINAYTYYEYTVYHATLTARHWSMALEVLTDAVLHSVFDPAELEREKKVVLEEIGMRNDRPNVKLFQKMMAHAYTVHPYRLPIIGSEESIAAISRDDILAYMKKHYAPENFTVVVVGDVKGVDVVEKVKALMGGLVRGNVVNAPLPVEPARTSSSLFMLEEDVNQSHMALALPISRFDSPDTPVLDVIAQIIGHGEASRLYRSLRDEKGLVYAIDGSAFTPHDPGLFEISAVLDGVDIIPALEATLVELFKLKYTLVSDDELTRAKHNLEGEFIFNLERVQGQAKVLGSFEFLAGDPREDKYLDEIRAVSREDIKRTAGAYFSGHNLTAGFLVPAGIKIALDEQGLSEMIARAEETARHSQPASLMSDTFLSNVYRYQLPNGIRLVVREDQKVPTVAVRAVFPGGLRAETPAINGAFAFISQLLPKGTEKMSAQEISLLIARMAGDLSGFNGKNTFGIKADFLSRFFEQGLALVADIIRIPAFDPAEAEKIRPELMSQLRQQEDSLPALAFKEFNRLLFDGHPYGLNTLGSAEALQSFTPAALKDIYKRHSRSDQLVLAVSGAVQAEKVRALVGRLFGDWQDESRAKPAFEEEDFMPLEPLLAPKKFSIARDKEQVHIILGFYGATMKSRDRYGLEVLDTVLSGQSGRLFAELRDKQSLAYSLSSFSLLGLDTGSFGIYIGTSPDKKDKAVAELWRQLQKVRTDLISEAELTRAKNILIGNYELGLQTHGAQAFEMALNENYGLGQDFGIRYIDEINKVDAGMVLAAAQKYILADRYVMVTVGANSVTAEKAE